MMALSIRYSDCTECLCPVDMTLYSFTECLSDTRIRGFVYSLCPMSEKVAASPCFCCLHDFCSYSVFQKLMRWIRLSESMPL